MTCTWWWISLVLLVLGFVASLAAIYQGTKNAFTLTEHDGGVTFTTPDTFRKRVRAGAVPGIALALATLGGLAGLLASPPA